jgi:hypothetical protein
MFNTVSLPEPVYANEYAQMGRACKLDLGNCPRDISSRSAIPEVMVFESLACRPIVSSFCGSPRDRFGDEGCSFGESTMVVERWWGGGGIHPSFRLRCRLNTLRVTPRTLV